MHDASGDLANTIPYTSIMNSCPIQRGLNVLPAFLPNHDAPTPLQVQVLSISGIAYLLFYLRWIDAPPLSRVMLV